MRAIPAAALLGRSASIRVRITSELIAQFAALTGDRSSLHVDDAFARRSAYRQPIVHGMLPVGCLALLPSLQVEGFRAVPVGLTGRFAAPVFPGDSLTLAGGPARPGAGGTNVEVDYAITRDQTTVTDGTITLAYEPFSGLAVGTARTAAAPLVSGLVNLNDYRLEEIEVGTADAFDFCVSDGAVNAFVSLLRAAVDPDAFEPSSSPEQHIDLATFLSILLYSTSVGVSLPGASATFLGFSAGVERPVELDTPYRLRGRITHRSLGTRIVKKELLVTPAAGDNVVVRGKATTLVAKPFTPMPTVAELKAQGTDFGLDGKVVLVTGASRGIGETTAKLFALHGARVIVNYHRGADDAARVVQEIESGGGAAIAVAADVSSAEQVDALVTRARERFGRVDILVNNAARDYRPIPFLQLSWTDIQKDIDVIVKGAFLCCQAVIPMMLEQGGGRIVNISTVAVDAPPADQTKYVVAKSGLVGLTRSLSIEFASRNIQVNLVVPNFVETDLVAHIQDGFRKKIARDIPMQRAAAPVDVARAVVFLASSYSSFTTGQKVMVTGGGAPYL